MEFWKKKFIYLNDRVTERDRKRDRETEGMRHVGNIYWLIPQTNATARAGFAETRSQKLHLNLHVGGRGPSTGTIIYCLPGYVSRKLGWERSCQVVIWHSDRGCP